MTERTVELVETAAEETVYLTVEELLTDGLVDELAAASERVVAIGAAAVSDGVERNLRDAVPDVELFESLWDWSETPAGRLQMVEGEKTLVSVLVPHESGRPSGSRDETAISEGRTRPTACGDGPADDVRVATRRRRDGVTGRSPASPRSQSVSSPSRTSRSTRARLRLSSRSRVRSTA